MENIENSIEIDVTIPVIYRVSVYSRECEVNQSTPLLLVQGICVFIIVVSLLVPAIIGLLITLYVANNNHALSVLGAC